MTADRKTVRVVLDNTRHETMVHWPNGAVEWLGPWALLKLLWWLVRREHRIVIVDAKSGKETEA